MTGGDHARPAAQYGEYASPEEQAKARGTAAPAAAHPPVEPYGAPVASTVLTGPSRREHPVDRVVTLVLLAFGLFVVLSGIPGYLSMADVLQEVYAQVGAGEYTATELSASLGISALVVQGALWALTALFSVLALRRGRIAWWIPVVGGVVAFIALMIIVSIALMADPGFIASLS